MMGRILHVARELRSLGQREDGASMALHMRCGRFVPVGEAITSGLAERPTSRRPGTGEAGDGQRTRVHRIAPTRRGLPSAEANSLDGDARGTHSRE